MAKKAKKHATEMTSEELAKRIFPPKLHAHMKELVQKLDSEAVPPKKDKPK
jgi:hypothetical protein